MAPLVYFRDTFFSVPDRAFNGATGCLVGLEVQLRPSVLRLILVLAEPWLVAGTSYAKRR